jgi:hypothetical protein
MHPTHLLAAAVLGLLAAHPSPSPDAPSAPDRTVAGGGTGVLGYRVHHNRDAHIGALAADRQ